MGFSSCLGMGAELSTRAVGWVRGRRVDKRSASTISSDAPNPTYESGGSLRGAPATLMEMTAPVRLGGKERTPTCPNPLARLVQGFPEKRPTTPANAPPNSNDDRIPPGRAPADAAPRGNGADTPAPPVGERCDHGPRPSGVAECPAMPASHPADSRSRGAVKPHGARWIPGDPDCRPR
uniref:Uncharacterized protein n=1 Tax=Candidatus Kentrum sp. UNK TaxID=2126344 RepID=A0A451B2R1_9GAMM|nr:MAG: hypothetical protein BECKUNK1418H_GA0071006_11225 [Candidatus Kentron sp. UNK]